MTKPQPEIAQLKAEAESKLAAATTPDQLEDWRVEYLGRKGLVPQFLRGVKNLPESERKQAGQEANELRGELEDAFEEKKRSVGESGASATNEEISYGLEGSPGHLHPITATIRQLRDIFAALGFAIVEGPDIEEAKINFDNLNIDFEHPARAETDTFYIKDHPELVLRTHVSTLQSRAVLEHDLTPPFKIMYYGSSFRSEKEDPTHLSVFQQYEFLAIDKNINLSDLKSIIETVYSMYFGTETTIRFRPSYFPFVEPGLEIDMACVFCAKGCRVCSHTGWLEMAGSGMVHPNVLRNLNVDPSEYQGIALGGGLDRLAMLKYNIPDIRYFYSGNMRFLKQFG